MIDATVEKKPAESAGTTIAVQEGIATGHLPPVISQLLSDVVAKVKRETPGKGGHSK